MTAPDPVATPGGAAPQPPTGPPPPGAPGSPPPGGAPSVATPAPDRRTQPGLILGMILVVVGAGLLVGRVAELNLAASAWPVWIVVVGLAMLVGSFFIPPRGGVGLAIPGAIVTMVGLVVWVQDAYDLYATWAYAWALVAPTGVGLGMMLYGLVRRDGELASDGLRAHAHRPGSVHRVRDLLRGRHRPIRPTRREPGPRPAVRRRSPSAWCS